MDSWNSLVRGVHLGEGVEEGGVEALVHHAASCQQLGPVSRAAGILIGRREVRDRTAAGVAVGGSLGGQLSQRTPLQLRSCEV